MADKENGIKVILLGESSVGKTSLINISTGGKFRSAESSTLNANYRHKKIQYNGKNYVFNLWDTIGQEKYRALTKVFFKDSKIVVLVYDITEEKSFKELDYWYNQIIDEIGKENCLLAVVGNKKIYIQKKK